MSSATKIRTSQELGELIRQYRTSQKILQADIVGLANTGNRFIVGQTHVTERSFAIIQQGER